LTNPQTNFCASCDTKTARRDRAPGPILERVYRQAPGELACIRPAFQKIIRKGMKSMVLSPENEKLREQALTSALKALISAIDDKEELTTAPEKITSLTNAAQALRNL
jgi:hypothetical protein